MTVAGIESIGETILVFGFPHKLPVPHLYTRRGEIITASVFLTRIRRGKKRRFAKSWKNLGGAPYDFAEVCWRGQSEIKLKDHTIDFRHQRHACLSSEKRKDRRW